MKSIEKCKGCRLLRYYGIRCAFPMAHKVHLCLCVNCLVKVMCKKFCRERILTEKKEKLWEEVI